MSFFVFFRSVRKKLQFTVFLDHPVANVCYTMDIAPYSSVFTHRAVAQDVSVVPNVLMSAIESAPVERVTKLEI